MAKSCMGRGWEYINFTYTFMRPRLLVVDQEEDLVVLVDSSSGVSWP